MYTCIVMKAFHCVLGINVKHAVPKNILKPIKYISFQESSFLIDMRLSVCLSVCLSYGFL